MLDKIERLTKELKRPERYKGEHATIKNAIDKEKRRRVRRAKAAKVTSEG